MLEWVKKQLDKISAPTLDWVQVEVTTYCNASCIYCPHTVLKNRWANKHMSLETFNELMPFLKYTDLVYLQGWGEPLLNDNFSEMIRICKNQGKRVGFTTNGMLLTENTIRMLVDLQVDIVGISLAGTFANTHNQIRKGTDFNQLVAHLESLQKIKAERKIKVPAVHIAYLMLKSNFHELNNIVQLAKRVGAKQIVDSNLTLVVEPKLAAEALFNDSDRTDFYRETLDEIKNRSAGENIIFDYHGPGLDDESIGCRENVRHACVINVDGEVVPCVFTNPVLCENHNSGIDELPYFTFKDQSLLLRGMSFGNMRNETLTRIWNQKEYACFRDLFDPEIMKKPEHIRSEMLQCCINCYKRLGA